MKTIILASTSPRRKELLEKTKLPFTVKASDYKENLNLNLKPRVPAKHLSLGKASAVASKCKKSIVIGADTFIVFKGKILGKPQTEKEAFEMLKRLSGDAHSVITGFTIIDSDTKQTISKSVETKAFFRKLTNKEINNYVKSKEPLDKAGAYAIQGLGAVLVEKIDGDYFNVVGLPLNAVVQCLRVFGVDVLRMWHNRNERWLGS